MPTCRRCETLPSDYQVDGTLYLVPPVAPVTAALKQYLQASRLPYGEPHPDVFSIPLAGGVLLRLCREFFCTLGKAEQHDTKSLVMADGRTPSIQELVQMQPLSTLLARVQGQWLVELLREERVTSYFQPIVCCGQGQPVYGHECLLRGADRDGGLVPPGPMFDVAREGDLLFHLDRAARLSAIRAASAHGLDGMLFINFNPTSIYRPSHCLQTTLEAIRTHGISHERIVFEVVESDQVKDVRHLIEVVSFYRDQGFKIALDDLGAGYSSLNLLHHLRPDYLKLDIELVRGVHQDPFKARLAANLLEMSESLGMISIAEGIECQEEYAWCVANKARLAQGFFFGKPSPNPRAAAPPGRAPAKEGQ